MSSIETKEISSSSLIHYTRNDVLATDEPIFKSFIKTWCGINANITETDCEFAKICIEKDEIRSGELKVALIEAYKDPNRYGKVEWNDIWKHIKRKREEKCRPGRANAGAYAVA